MRFVPQRRAIFRHRNFKKWPEPLMFLTLWVANRLRASGVQSFDIATSKSGPRPSLKHFNLKMRFSLQRRTIFRHRDFKKRSEGDVFCQIWLENMLKATAACKFSCLLWAATSAPAALASLLFDPADQQTIGKTQHFATFLTFSACVSSFFWSDFRAIVSSFFWLYSSLLFHLLTLLLWSAFQLSILSEFLLLNFLW